MQETCRRLTHVYVKVANERLGCQLPPKLPVRFDLHEDSRYGGKCAGLAVDKPLSIAYNMFLLRDNFQTFLDVIVPHEISHIIIYDKFHSRGVKVQQHGPEFRHVMRTLGRDPLHNPPLDFHGLRVHRRAEAKKRRQELQREELKLAHTREAKYEAVSYELESVKNSLFDLQYKLEPAIWELERQEAKRKAKYDRYYEEDEYIKEQECQ